jgi:hypothetical protein
MKILRKAFAKIIVLPVNSYSLSQRAVKAEANIKRESLSSNLTVQIEWCASEGGPERLGSSKKSLCADLNFFESPR